jgi:hypothetical protein
MTVPSASTRLRFVLVFSLAHLRVVLVFTSKQAKVALSN